jgi:hypothetical protein
MSKVEGDLQIRAENNDDVYKAAYEDICTCKKCKHGLVRDCKKSHCKCCIKEDHDLVLDGIEGFMPTDRDDEKIQT